MSQFCLQLQSACTMLNIFRCLDREEDTILVPGRDLAHIPMNVTGRPNAEN